LGYLLPNPVTKNIISFHHQRKNKERMMIHMNDVAKRIDAIHLMRMIEDDPKFAKEIGTKVVIKNKDLLKEGKNHERK
jgi:hypothetical protein